MFTGIIETLGRVINIEKEQVNIRLRIESAISAALKVDQSVSHNGICLTVVECNEYFHEVVAVKETLDKTNLGGLKIGDWVNLERAAVIGARLDGHIVQGHIDGVGVCREIISQAGSWRFRFSFETSFAPLLVNKGSVCINGVSLTVIDPDRTNFEVAIIPYTFEQTTFKYLQPNDTVNLEFDILAKYFLRLAALNR